MHLILLLGALFWNALSFSAEPPPQGAALLKTDLMFVGAHPDDETGIAATLARYAGQGKTVACVYVTRGEGGGNMVGTQAGPALGILREAELRRCLAKLGVTYVYFLDEEDFFYTESLSATMARWDKQDALGKLVRVVRSLRPAVIVTMNPAPNPGQHGHHQTAAVLATEAFSAAAAPGAFPEQLEREGLNTWQVRKLYYGIGNERSVKIRTDETLPNGAIPADLAASALAEHRSQAFGNFGNSPWLRRPQSFLLARTAVPVQAPEPDLLDGIEKPLAQISLESPPTSSPFAFEPRPAITRFLAWARENGVSHTQNAFPADIPVIAGRVNVAPFHGGTLAKASISDPKWRVERWDAKGVRVNVPSDARADAELVALSSDGTEAKVRLHPLPFQSIHLNGSPAVLHIATNLIVQGRPESPADCSANATISVTREALTISVMVRDDRVVSNIEPNDIKGHWRSDSVEICIDPNPGSEHTMNTFKLGIFPFDTTGTVRAARDADANQGPIERTAPRVKLTSSHTPDGYVVTAAIPWKDIGAKAKRGTMLGFNIIIYDGDKADAAPGENINKTRLAWSPRPGVQGRPEDWGRLQIE